MLRVAFLLVCFLVMLALLLLAVAACDSGYDDTPEPKATVAPAVASATGVPTVTPTPTPVPTLRPPTMVAPTETPAPTPTSTATPRPTPTPLPRIPSTLDCTNEQFIQEILDLSSDNQNLAALRILKLYSGATELERTERVLRCTAEARLSRGGDAYVTYYYEIDRDGDGFIGYDIGASIATPTPITTPTPHTIGPTSTPEPGFGDGTWFVGADIAAGLYAAGPGLDSCYWERLSGFRGNSDDTIANDFGNPRPIVYIVSTDKGFTSQGCGRWQPLSDVLNSLTTIPDGTWSIPEEVAAGTYSAPGGESCYWERLGGFSGDFDDIIANDFGG